MIYVMNYMSTSSYEAECDDPSRAGRDLTHEDMASPQIAAVSRTFYPADLDRFKHIVEQDELEMWAEYDDKGVREHEAFEAWRATATYEAGHWFYGADVLRVLPDGTFETLGTTHDSKSKAEWHLFYNKAINEVAIPKREDAPTYTWQTDGWVECDAPKRSHQVLNMYHGENLVAIMVIQRLQEGD